MHNFSIKSLCKNDNLTVLTPTPVDVPPLLWTPLPMGFLVQPFTCIKLVGLLFFSFYSLFLCISLDTCVLVGKYVILSCVLFIYV